MDDFLVLLVFVGFPIATVMLRRSIAVWIPSALLLAYWFYERAEMRAEQSGDGALGGLDGIGLAILGGIVGFNALIALIASMVHRLNKKRAPAAIPPAVTLPSNPRDGGPKENG